MITISQSGTTFTLNDGTTTTYTDTLTVDAPGGAEGYDTAAIGGLTGPFPTGFVVLDSGTGLSWTWNGASFDEINPGSPNSFTPDTYALDTGTSYDASVEFTNTNLTDLGAGAFTLSGPSAGDLSLDADRSTVILPGDPAFALGISVLSSGFGTVLDASLDVESTQGDYSISIVGNPPSYLPATLAGYVADWNARNIAGADASSVTSWTSYTDSGLIATQTVGKGAGVLRTTSFDAGTLPGVDLYTNTAQFNLPAAVRTAVLAGTGAELWVVYKRRGAAATAAETNQFGSASAAGAGLYPFNPSDWYISFMNANQTNIGVVTSLEVPHTIRYTASGVSGSRTIRGYKNNVLVGSTTQTISVRATWTIGGDYSGQRTGGDIAHFIIFSAPLSAGDATALQAFLVAYWGL